MKAIVALGLASSLGLAGSITLGIAGANAATTVTSHVAWCDQHYRSYNAATDAYVGFDGLYHRCVSPSADQRTFAIVSPSFVPYDITPNGRKNPNGLGSGTAFRLYPDDNEGGNNGTSAP
jgi:BA14K-like protein